MNDMVVQSELSAEEAESLARLRASSPESSGPTRSTIEPEVNETSLTQYNETGGLAYKIARNVAEIPRGMLAGAMRAGQEILDSTFSMSQWLEENVVSLGTIGGEDPNAAAEEIKIPQIDMTTPTGQITSGIFQFITGFVPAFRAVKLARAGQGSNFVNSMMAGVIADALFFDPHEERLSDLINEYPDLRNPVTDYLAASPDDSEAEGRFKNAVEGAVAGGAVDGFIRGLRLIRSNRRIRETPPDPERGISPEELEQTDEGTFVPEGVPIDPEVMELSDAVEIKALNPEQEMFVVAGGRKDKLPEYHAFKTFDEAKTYAEENFGTVGKKGKADSGEEMWMLIDENTDDALTEVGHIVSGRLLHGYHGVFKEGVSESQIYLDPKQATDDLRARGYRDFRTQEDGSFIANRFKPRAGVQPQVDFAGDTIKATNDPRSMEILDVITPRESYRQAQAMGSNPLVRALGENQVSQHQVEKFLHGTTDEFDDVEINFSWIRSAEDIEEVFKRTTKVLGNKVDLKTTDEEITKAADKLGLMAEDILERDIGDAFKSPADVRAAQVILTQSAERVNRLANYIREGNDSTAALFAFVQSMKINAALFNRFTGASTRAGQILRQLGATSKVTGKHNSLAHIDEMLRLQFEGQDLTRLGVGKSIKNLYSIRARVRELANLTAELDDVAKVNELTKEIHTPKFWSMAYETWINALLSGPKTHMVNMMSNGLVAAWLVPERLVAAGVSKLTGSDSTYAGESMAMLFGSIKGFQKGMGAFFKIAGGGDIPTATATKNERIIEPQLTADNIARLPAIEFMGKRLSQVTPTALRNSNTFGWATWGLAKSVDAIGAVSRYPSRLLVAEDMLWKGIGEEAEQWAEIYKRVRASNVNDPEEIGRMMGEMLSNTYSAAYKSTKEHALEMADYRTFTNPMGEIGRGVQNLFSAIKLPGGAPLGRVLQPFIRTPTNIIKFGIERTPFAPLMRQFREDIAAGGARGDAAIAKMAMGSFINMAIMDMTFNGFIVGALPEHRELRDNAKDQGYQGYSVVWNGKTYSFNRLEPLGMIVGIAADLAQVADQMTDGELTTITSSLVAAVASSIGDKSFLQGSSLMFKAYNEPERYLASWMGQMAGTVVPTGVAQYTRGADPEVKEIRSVMDRIMSRLPGWSEQVPPKRNIYGQPIHRPGGFFQEMVNPVYITTLKDEPIDKEIDFLDLAIGRTPRQVEGVELTPDEFDLYARLSGGYDPDTGDSSLKDQLNTLVTGSGWDKLPFELRKSVIKNVVQERRATARQRMLGSRDPNLQDLQVRVREAMGDRFSAGAGESRDDSQGIIVR